MVILASVSDLVVGWRPVSGARLSRRVGAGSAGRLGSSDPRVSRWTAAHTDLHWANLLAPGYVLVDWEGWGLAPAGYDAAYLFGHSLLVPEVAERVREVLGGQLQTPDGLPAQLYTTTRLLQRVDQGDYPGMAIPLHRNADQVIEQLAVRFRLAASAGGTAAGRRGTRGSG